MDRPNSCTILGVRIDRVTMREALDRADAFLQSGQHHIVTVNPEFLLEAKKNPHFKEVLNDSSLSVPDGVGLRLGAFLSRTTLPERVAGADLFDQLCGRAEEKGSRVMLFGAAKGIARRAAQALRQTYPHLLLVGAENEESILGWRRSEREILGRIRRRRPAILFVALGSPQQDLWIARNLHLLPSVHLAMGIGGTLDYTAGVIPRAPGVLQKSGFEWLWRLFHEKKGLRAKRFRRILRAIVIFPLTVFFSRS